MNWCKPSPCKNGGTCRQSGTTYSCQCQTGWTGLYCDVPSVSCEVAAKQQGKTVDGCICECTSCFISCFCHTGRLIYTKPAFTSSVSSPQVWKLPDCAVTQASVWMLGTHTTASAKQDTQAATARSRWMSVSPTPARTVLPALIT